MKDKVTLIDYHKGMHTYFRILDAGQFLDRVLLQGRCVTIDLVKFDEWLHARHGHYEDQGLSMAQLLEEAYGKDARDFVARVINFLPHRDE